MKSIVYRPTGYPLTQHVFAVRSASDYSTVMAWIYQNGMGWDYHMIFTGSNGYGFTIKDEAKRAWFILKWNPVEH